MKKYIKYDNLIEEIFYENKEKYQTDEKRIISYRVTDLCDAWCIMTEEGPVLYLAKYFDFLQTFAFYKNIPNAKLYGMIWTDDKKWPTLKCVVLFKDATDFELLKGEKEVL